MLKIQSRVHRMMVALNLPLPNEDKPGIHNLKFDLLRNLVEEETEEFSDAMQALRTIQLKYGDWKLEVIDMIRWKKRKDKDRNRYIFDLEELAMKCADDFEREVTLFWWTESIDAMCDVLVTTMNTANAMGIDIEPFFDEIHRTNLEKANGPLREDGKRLKPLDWKPPRIREMLESLLKLKNVIVPSKESDK